MHLLRLFCYLLIIPLGFIASHTSLANESICYWYTHYNLLCPMCGGTRSFIHFITFQFQQAYSYNPVLTLSVYPIMAFLVLQDSYTIIANHFFSRNQSSLLLFFINLLNRKES
ncbi:DUF2752 domain-containing protein [Holtiella tumoricola]|uniref:DUF2752 domain-containing protein n=1 Tax=Holtiella tumoricola TaxID=3018743 RepID=UPI003A7F2028